MAQTVIRLTDLAFGFDQYECFILVTHFLEAVREGQDVRNYYKCPLI